MAADILQCVQAILVLILFLHGQLLKLQLWDLKVLQILFSGMKLHAAENPDEMRKQKVQEYTEKFANPYVAASFGHIDAVINPMKHVDVLIHTLKVSAGKTEIKPPKKHGVPPF